MLSDASAPGILRHATERDILGGYSNVTRILLRRFLDGLPNFADGVAVNAEAPRLVRVKAFYTLFDGDAMRMLWTPKGASGLKPCMHGRNCFSKPSGMQTDEYSVTICCQDWARFESSSDADVWAQYDFLARSKGTTSAGDFYALRLRSGI